jgi:queuosine precursor transporter
MGRQTRRKRMIYVALWLAAIVTANYTTAVFGPEVSILNSFLLIGLMLTTRDKLHSLWEGKGLKWKMAALIAAGGSLSYMTQPATGSVALASIVAFSISETVDTIVYHHTRSVNKSNTASAFVDSLIFPAIAFGCFMPFIFAGQFLSKVFGGYVWSKAKIIAPVAACLFVWNTAGAAEGNFQTYYADGDIVHTAEVIVPDRGFAFLDYSRDAVYGEVMFTPHIWGVNPTVQCEFGSSDLFPIEEVGLVGLDWNGFQVLYRTDKNVQLTYSWFILYKHLQFTGFIDVTRDNLIAQPQVWLLVVDGGYIGCEAQWFDKKYVGTNIGVKLDF